MIYLVTGGAGFLGTNLCIRLLNQGKKVICIDNLNTGSNTHINFLKKIGKSNFKFINKDITKNFQLNCDFIFNLACPASPPKYQNLSIETLNVNFIGTMNMCNLALKNDCPILHTSTSEVYGDPLVSPQIESYRGNVNTMGPRACYDEGKRVAETIFYEFKNKYNLNAKIVRIFNTFGPYMSPSDGRVVSNFINQALKNKNITIYGDGKQTRSLCYVDDTIDALINFSKLRKNFIGPINIGNNIELSINEISKIILKLTKSKSKIVFKNLPEDDPLKRIPDLTLAHNILKWKPKVNIEFGLNQTISYFKRFLF